MEFSVSVLDTASKIVISKQVKFEFLPLINSSVTKELYLIFVSFHICYQIMGNY